MVEHRPGRYAFHDLLRAYAIELAEAGDPASDRRAALHRVLDHYLRTANAAALLLHPHRDVVDLPPAQPAVEPELITDPARALDWFAAEHRVLLATIERAATDGFDLHAWQLAWSFWEYLDRRGHWHDWVDTQHTAVAAARRIADSRGEAHAHRSLGLAYLQLGALEEADDHFWSALDRYGELGDRAGQARIHHNLCGVLEQQARYVDALDHAHRALELFRSAGHEQGQANALNGVGWFYTHLGRHDDAIDNCRQALVLLEKIGDRRGEANTWDSIGYAHHQVGRYPDAIDCYRRSLTLYRELGDRYLEADTLTHLGATHHAAGDRRAADGNWRDALRILDELGHPDAEKLRSRLLGTVGLDGS